MVYLKYPSSMVMGHIALTESALVPNCSCTKVLLYKSALVPMCSFVHIAPTPEYSDFTMY